MGRVIGSVVLGYLVLFAVVFVLMSLGYVALGAEGSFQPGSWEVSAVWVVITIVVGLVAGVAGGFVCAAVAKSPRGPHALMGLVVVLGVLFAIPVLTGQPADAVSLPRPDTLGMFDAMQNAIQPVWIALLNPLLGIVGVLVGAKIWHGAQQGR